ncbi:NAD(P)-binding domain-containing protein [Streptosporangium sp. NPDC001681]|uniref:NAD(P)-binding domain-containing protein n=1 Tax=Streptosporangium sp. NPDC001681 TaxID=3154395 RepID=UPI0033235F6D
MRLGFIGLGQMGAPIATHLAGWPGGLLVHDIRAESCGISPKAPARAVKHSDAITSGPGAIMLRKTTGPVTPDDPWYDILLHVRTLREKDLTLALELARARGVETPLAALALEQLADGLGVPHERSHG